MSRPTAEQRFTRGLAALASGRPIEAADCFAEALEIEARHGAQLGDMRYLSYYGHSLDLAAQEDPAALLACERAWRSAPGRATTWLNLGRAYARRGRIDAALRCYEHGLWLSPGHLTLRRTLAALDRRQRPTFGFLPRSNALNRWTGRLRATLARRKKRSNHDHSPLLSSS